ncbi:Pimeloyl-ACP methyl ester carboxylesterase [Dyella sp. OK004]|uniref:alpha/beta fold hydrolase n=1 Tax=Dyella sp. OK004 TaxID=1855292 RepID=UPI0008F03D40|nr:alpha/beta hydrolase [Dyella sp. OK004]SFS03704.1 Pimeloyl-ACP methyl ester carboxylesterase [Dyella sp. OK004]
MKLFALLLSLLAFCTAATAAEGSSLREGWQEVDGLHIFYREAGNPTDPTVVFLHGNPLSSIMYAKVMENIAAHQRVHVIAMDYPSFGYSDAPSRDAYRYTFDHLAQTVADFLKARGIERYGLYMQDYGVPVGFRLISTHPEAVTAIIVQNGVIHLDGFPSAQDPNGELRRHWVRRNPAIDQRRINYIKSMTYPQAVGWEDEDHAGLDASLQMVAAAQRPGVAEARSDLWFDYGTNVGRYPQWQATLRKLKVPVLVLWGKRDQFFTTPGAKAYLRDAPQAEVHVLDSTHFATLDAPDEVAHLVGGFLASHRLVLGRTEP